MPHGGKVVAHVSLSHSSTSSNQGALTNHGLTRGITSSEMPHHHPRKQSCQCRSNKSLTRGCHVSICATCHAASASRVSRHVSMVDMWSNGSVTCGMPCQRYAMSAEGPFIRMGQSKGDTWHVDR